MNLLKSSLCEQLNILQRHCIEIKPWVHASYKVAEQLAKKGKRFADVEFVKLCILATVEYLCVEKIKLFQDYSLSACTVT
jgi:hypothetical protein